jgi:drug/metabolite transporter (DMT)-like permease
MSQGIGKMFIPFAYIGVIIIWSTTPLAIKWSGENGNFLFSVSGRMALGALLTILIIVLKRIDFPWHAAARRCYFIMSLFLYGSMMSTYWAAQFVPSGLISILFGISPIITSILTVVILKEQHFSLNKWLGMLIGIIGIALIFNTELSLNKEAIKGLLAMLFAVFLQSLSSVLIKQMNIVLPALVMTAGGLLVALLFYGITWLCVGETIPHFLSWRAILALIYLSLFGSVIGLVLYYSLLKQIEATKVALITLITPIVALLLGQNLNGEVIHPLMWIGTSMVLSGLALYQWGERLIIRWRKLIE